MIVSNSKERECDLFDINSAVTAFVNVIEAHQKDDVLVNLSTGSKANCHRGMMACQSSSATPFYVAPNFENEDGSREAPSEPLVDSIGEMFDLPVFRLSSPSPDQLAILRYLQAQNGATKRTHSTRPRRGTQVYNRYLFENRRRALQTTRNTHHQTAPRTELHPRRKRRSQKACLPR